MEIPIIILNWNGLKDTDACIEALMKQTLQTFKIYLVDNGSADDSPLRLQANYGKHPKIELILNEKNLGFTRGNNEVLSNYVLPNVDYEYVVLLNNDTVPAIDWLENLVESAKKNQADIVSSKMVDFFEPEKMDNAGHMMLNTGEVLPIGHGEPVENYTKGFENMGACAGAALYRTAMLKDIGIFDEHFDTGYEDAELGIRAVITGYKCWYEPTAIVYHKMGQSIKKIFNYEYSLTIQKHIWYSYVKLMPYRVIAMTLPSFLVKYTAMLVINLVFWRTKFMKIMFQSLKEALWDEIDTTLEARENFYIAKKLAVFSLLKKQHFFLWIDIKRFYKYFILHEHSALDVYGKVEKV